MHEKYQNNLNTLKIEPIWIPISMMSKPNKRIESNSLNELKFQIEFVQLFFIFAYKIQMHLIHIYIWF